MCLQEAPLSSPSASPPWHHEGWVSGKQHPPLPAAGRDCFNFFGRQNSSGRWCWLQLGCLATHSSFTCRSSVCDPSVFLGGKKQAAGVSCGCAGTCTGLLPSCCMWECCARTGHCCSGLPSLCQHPPCSPSCPGQNSLHHHHHHPAASPRCPQQVWSRAGGTRSPHGE